MLILVIVNYWDDIKGSDAYQSRFNQAHWAQAQLDKERSRQQLAMLDQKECAILIRAREQTIPIEIERNAIFGISREYSENLLSRQFAADQKLCSEHGISPYQPIPE